LKRIVLANDRDADRHINVFLVILLVLFFVVLGPVIWAGLMEGMVSTRGRGGVHQHQGMPAALVGGLWLGFALLPLVGLWRRSRWRRHLTALLYGALTILVALRTWQLAS